MENNALTFIIVNVHEREREREYLSIIATFLNNLRCHPMWSANELTGINIKH